MTSPVNVFAAALLSVYVPEIVAVPLTVKELLAPIVSVEPLAVKRLWMDVATPVVTEPEADSETSLNDAAVLPPMVPVPAKIT